MNEYERKLSKQNPFSLSFGSKPYICIERNAVKNEIIQKITAENPISRSFVITGVRGSGKTVMLTSIIKYFEDKDDWLVIDLNARRTRRKALSCGTRKTSVFRKEL